MKHSINCQLDSIIEYVCEKARQRVIPVDDLKTIEEKLHLMGAAVAFERRRIIAPRFWEDYTDGGAA